MPTYSTAFTHDTFSQYVNDHVNGYMETHAFLSRVKKDLGKGGQNIKFDIDISQGTDVRTVGPYLRMDTIRAPREFQQVEATVPWSEYGISDVFDGQEMSRCTGKEQIRDYVANRMEKLEGDMDLTIDQEAQVGDGTVSGGNVGAGGNGLRCLGVQQVVTSTPTSGTLYGLSRSAVTATNNYTLAGSAGPTGDFDVDIWYILAKAYQNVNYVYRKGAKAAPDLCLFTRANIVIAELRMLNQNTNLAGTSAGSEKNYSFKGMILDVDDSLTASTIQMLNTGSWRIASPDKALVKTRGIVNHPSYNIGSLAKDIQMQFALYCLSPRNQALITSAAS